MEIDNITGEQLNDRYRSTRRIAAEHTRSRNIHKIFGVEYIFLLFRNQHIVRISKLTEELRTWKMFVLLSSW